MEMTLQEVIAYTALPHLYTRSRIYLKFLVFYILDIRPIWCVAVSISGIHYNEVFYAYSIAI